MAMNDPKWYGMIRPRATNDPKWYGVIHTRAMHGKPYKHGQSITMVMNDPKWYGRVLNLAAGC